MAVSARKMAASRVPQARASFQPGIIARFGAKKGGSGHRKIK